MGELVGPIDLDEEARPAETLADAARRAWSETHAAKTAEITAELRRREAHQIELNYDYGHRAIEYLMGVSGFSGGNVTHRAMVSDTAPTWALDGQGAEIDFDGLVIGVEPDTGRADRRPVLRLRAQCPECGEWQFVGQFGTLEGLGQLLTEEVPPTGCVNVDCPVYFEIETAPTVEDVRLASLEKQQAAREVLGLEELDVRLARTIRAMVYKGAQELEEPF